MDDKWYTIWSIIHVLLYILIGLFIPNNWWFAIIISILWEIYEYIMSLLSKDEYYHEVLINRFCDIGFNLFGYYIGSIIVNTINKN
jgi:hypothetical protein